ncbi:MAG: hypothetical protein AAF660_00060 [Pseudomonadota bacterium]
MSGLHHYDTVAFDVRDNTTMLFFAKTAEPGDIDDYLLVMRTINDDFDEILTVEINEEQVSGEALIDEARLMGNTLQFTLGDSMREWLGADALTISFEETSENIASIEAGAFRVLGDLIAGGNA